MIVYEATKQSFIEDVVHNKIEIISWRNSLQYMMNVLMDKEI